MLWDGIGFFGFTDYKLDRLEGKPPTYYDRFKNPYFMFKTTGACIAFGWVLGTQIQHLHTVSSQTISYENENSYEYKADQLKYALI